MAAAATDEASSHGGLDVAAIDIGKVQPVDDAAPQVDTANDLFTQASQTAPAPASPTPGSAFLTLTAAARPGQDRPGQEPGADLTTPTATADGTRADRPLTGTLSQGQGLGSNVLAQAAGMPLHPGTARAERPALATVERDLQSGLPARTGALPATEGADARLQGFVQAPVAESPTSPADDASHNQALSSFAGQLLRASPSATAPQGALPTATELNLPTPVSAPEFVPRLCGELAVLARGGVQEARVQVNPLELGPIAVQITLEGSHAQVHLAVDNAQTRALLEQSMPSLAAALRENGLTLTGGGVFQQARQNPREAEGRAARGMLNASGDAEPGGDAAATPAGRRRHLGVLDAYA